MQRAPHTSIAFDRRPNWHALGPDKRVRSQVTADPISMRALGFAIPLASLMWIAGLLIVFPHLGN